MKNLIIGTAGHVDHGKTSLIKALTNIDTDRLIEEKKRGITIDLGFAYMDLKNGERVGIIDVPGHEKFVKNMLAGAGGIDIALLIVSAVEGVMPQTKEHFLILKLLGINKGIIVITKCDLVESEFLEIVEDDIKSLVKGSFLENSKIINTSSYTKEGIDNLKSSIEEMVLNLDKEFNAFSFRMPIDRIFSADGFGTIVTGTAVDGSLNVEDEICLFPSMKYLKIRKLQVHGKDEVKVYKGQRIAINIAGIKKEDIKRGDVISKKGFIDNTIMVDVFLEISPYTDRIIKNNSVLHFHYGCRDLTCKLIIFGKSELKKGEKAYVQIRFSEEIPIRFKDNFILRYYSPLETIGGGVILNVKPKKYKTKNLNNTLNSLEILKKGHPEDVLHEIYKNLSSNFYEQSLIIKYTNFSNIEIEKYTNNLLKDDKLIRISENIVIDKNYYNVLIEKARNIFKDFYNTKHFKKAIKIEEFKSKLLNNKVSTNLLNKLDEDEIIDIKNNMVFSKEFKPKYSESEKNLIENIEKTYLESKYSPPTKDELLKKFKFDKTIYILDFLLEEKKLVSLDKEILLHYSFYCNSIEILEEHINKYGSISIGEFRDKLSTSRRYALAILENFDKKGLTKKVDDVRMLVKNS